MEPVEVPTARAQQVAQAAQAETDAPSQEPAASERSGSCPVAVAARRTAGAAGLDMHPAPGRGTGRAAAWHPTVSWHPAVACRGHVRRWVAAACRGPWACLDAAASDGPPVADPAAWDPVAPRRVAWDRVAWDRVACARVACARATRAWGRPAAQAGPACRAGSWRPAQAGTLMASRRPTRRSGQARPRCLIHSRRPDQAPRPGCSARFGQPDQAPRPQDPPWASRPAASALPAWAVPHSWQSQGPLKAAGFEVRTDDRSAQGFVAE